MIKKTIPESSFPLQYETLTLSLLPLRNILQKAPNTDCELSEWSLSQNQDRCLISPLQKLVRPVYYYYFLFFPPFALYG